MYDEIYVCVFMYAFSNYLRLYYYINLHTIK